MCDERSDTVYRFSYSPRYIDVSIRMLALEVRPIATTELPVGLPVLLTALKAPLDPRSCL